MLSIIEADRALQNERNIHATHGPEDYSKWKTNELKQEFSDRANMAKRSKLNRETNGFNDPGVHNRRKAEMIGKELARRGETPEYKKDSSTISKMRDSKPSKYFNNKPGAYTFRMEDLDRGDFKRNAGSSGTKEENEETKAAIRDHLKKKGIIKETCEYILSVIDEIE